MQKPFCSAGNFKYIITLESYFDGAPEPIQACATPGKHSSVLCPSHVLPSLLGLWWLRSSDPRVVSLGRIQLGKKRRE